MPCTAVQIMPAQGYPAPRGTSPCHRALSPVSYCAGLVQSQGMHCAITGRQSTSDFPAHYNYHSTDRTRPFDAAVPKTQSYPSAT